MRKLLALPLAIFTLGLVLVACSSPTPSTDPFENAMVAYKRHDSATAAKLTNQYYAPTGLSSHWRKTASRLGAAVSHASGVSRA